MSNIKPSEKRVVLQTGEELPYDVLVVATGTGGPFPVKLKFEDMDEAIHKYEEMAGKVNPVIELQKYLSIKMVEMGDAQRNIHTCIACKLRFSGNVHVFISPFIKLEMNIEFQLQIKNANTITVVGGGAAGIEFASEIKSEYPDKNVTMIHSHNKILEYPKITDAFREAVLGIMDRIKVAVILGEISLHNY